MKKKMTLTKEKYHPSKRIIMICRFLNYLCTWKMSPIVIAVSFFCFLFEAWKLKEMSQTTNDKMHNHKINKKYICLVYISLPVMTWLILITLFIKSDFPLRLLLFNCIKVQTKTHFGLGSEMHGFRIIAILSVSL